MMSLAEIGKIMYCMCTDLEGVVLTGSLVALSHLNSISSLSFHPNITTSCTISSHILTL